MTVIVNTLKPRRSYQQITNVIQATDTTSANFIILFATDVTTDNIINLFTAFHSYRDEIINLRKAKGINKIAREEEDEPSTYVFKDELLKLTDAMKVVTDWLVDNTNPNIFIRKSGNTDYTTITAVELAPVLPLLQAVRTEINLVVA